MRGILKLLVAALLGIGFQDAWGQTPSDIIAQTFKEVRENPRSLDTSADKASQALATFGAIDVCDALYNALQHADRIGNQVPAIMKITRRLPSFDIQRWVTHLERESDPMILVNGIFVSSVSKEAKSPQQKEFVRHLLSDKRVGQDRRGEARGYASVGLRVCDLALNLLWESEPEASHPPGYPLDAINSIERRDQLIADYAAKFKVQIEGDDASSTKSLATQPSVVVPQKAPAPKTATPPSPEPSSSTPWSIIVVLIVAACGLLWLLFKRRS